MTQLIDLRFSLGGKILTILTSDKDIRDHIF